MIHNHIITIYHYTIYSTQICFHWPNFSLSHGMCTPRDWGHLQSPSALAVVLLAEATRAAALPAAKACHLAAFPAVAAFHVASACVAGEAGHFVVACHCVAFPAVAFLPVALLVAALLVAALLVAAVLVAAVLAGAFLAASLDAAFLDVLLAAGTDPWLAGAGALPLAAHTVLAGPVAEGHAHLPSAGGTAAASSAGLAGFVQ